MLNKTSTAEVTRPGTWGELGQETRTAVNSFVEHLAPVGLPGISRLLVYGSRARGDYQADSDVDIAVVFAGAAPVPYERFKLLMQSLIQYRNEPEPVSLLNSARSRDRRLNWHHNAARFGCVQASEQPRSPLDLLVVEISIVGPVEFVGERYASGGKAVGNAPALSTGLSPRPAGRVPVRRTRPQIHRTGATL